jgi:snurportin-1
MGLTTEHSSISMLSAPVVTAVPNTVLRSRLVGKHLLPAFPSILPQNTILDCILDRNWTQNGILHVLDVIKWKGQDIGDCEASFRWVIYFSCRENGRLDYIHVVF